MMAPAPSMGLTSTLLVVAGEPGSGGGDLVPSCDMAGSWQRLGTSREVVRDHRVISTAIHSILMGTEPAKDFSAGAARSCMLLPCHAISMIYVLVRILIGRSTY